MTKTKIMRELFKVEEIKTVEVKTDTKLKVGDFVQFKGSKTNFKDKLEIGYYGFIKKSLGKEKDWGNMFLVDNYYFDDKKIEISEERIDGKSLTKGSNADLLLFLKEYQSILKKLDINYKELELKSGLFN